MHTPAEILEEASLVLSRTLDMESILESLLDLLSQVIPYDSASVFLVGADAVLTIRAVRGYERWTDAARVRVLTFDARKTSSLGTVLTTCQSLVIPDTQAYPGWERIPDTEHIRSWMGVPLIAGNAVIGVYSLDKAEAQFFTEEHRRLAENLAPLAALAIQNAQLFAREEKAREQAERLGAATRALSSTLDLGRVFELILTELQGLIPYDSASVMELKGSWLEVIGGHGFADMSKILGTRFDVNADNPNRDVVQSRAPVVVDDAPARYPVFSSGHFASTPILSWLGVPLLFGDQLVGMLALDKMQGGYFGPDHVKLAVSFASQAAIAMENARLYASAQRELAESKRSEQELRRSEERFEKVFRANPTAMSMSTLESGRVLDVNERFLAMTGYRRDEVLGRTLAELRFWENESEAAAVSRSMNERRAVPQMAFRYRTGAGEIREALGSFERIEIFDGPCVLTLAEDITDRRHLEAQLRQAQKMEAVGRLAGGIAHDFNNLLTAILGTSDLLLERPNLDPSVHSEVKEIRMAGERAAGLTRQLLAFSRQQVLQPVTLDLGAVVENWKSLLQRVLGDDVSLVTLTTPGLGRVRADPAQIEQVLVNLAVNSRHAMPTGGTLTIETANADIARESADSIAQVRTGDYVVLAVTDTGCGMDAATQARIFEPFFTTKPEGQGTGLGLSTVYGIVKQSEGYIWTESEPGRGATFKIYLPRIEEKVPIVRDRGAPLASPHGTETVLLVEDQEMVRRLIEKALRINGYSVLSCSSGAEALEIAGRFEGTIHLLLTDVVMPEMSGREVASRFSALRPGARVLYMSGYTDDGVTRHGVMESEVAFLQKPFRPVVLARTIRELLDRE